MKKKFLNVSFETDKTLWLSPVICYDVDAKDLILGFLCFYVFIEFRPNNK